MRYGYFLTTNGETLDEVMAVYMPFGKSYTGQDQVEVYCHGGRHIVRLILDKLVDSGARPAEPGEFTKLAFLGGRIDLTKAEAVAELIAANTEVSYNASREHLLGAYSKHIARLRENLVAILSDIEASIDFVEEDVDLSEGTALLVQLGDVATSLEQLLVSYRGGRIINEGFVIAIGGRPNAGKSSLFNLLLRQERAIVNPTAGTTRDYLSEWVDLEGYAVNLIDTAGVLKGGDQLEQLGQDMALKVFRRADLILWMVDLSVRGWRKRLESDLQRHPDCNIMLVGNKIDLLSEHTIHLPDVGGPSVCISCKTGRGIKQLRRTILDQINQLMPDMTSGFVVTSARHKKKLSLALYGVKRSIRLLKVGESPDIVAFELRTGVDTLDEITGRIYNEEILESIFSGFCIGK